jgi:hypothetical protein
MENLNEISISAEERQRWLAVMERVLLAALPSRIPPQMSPEPAPAVGQRPQLVRSA